MILCLKITFDIKNVIVVTIIRYLSRYLFRNADYWEKLGVKGPPMIPMIGSFFASFFTPSYILERKLLAKYGRLYG
jgi:hypothetical protein